MPNADLTITTDISEMDLDMLCHFIQQSYWGEGRSKESILKSFRHSLCYGVHANSQQVAFGRIVTDYVYHAYLCDLFVVESHRGKGIAKFLMNTILTDPRLSDVTSFTLATRTAHGLYEPFGFETVTDPSRYMVRV